MSTGRVRSALEGGRDGSRFRRRRRRPGGDDGRRGGGLPRGRSEDGLRGGLARGDAAPTARTTAAVLARGADRLVEMQGLVGKGVVMPVRRDSRTGRWFFRKQVRMHDGRRVRIFGVPTTVGLANTKLGAEEAERREVQRVLSTGVVKVDPPEAKEVPTVEEFTKVYLDVSRVDNKPSSVDTKDQILRRHIVPFFGALGLDRVTYAGIQD